MKEQGNEMTGRIINAPRKHDCHRGWIGPPGTPAGSVWECDCGRTWIAHYPHRNVFAPEFRPERRIERWLRQRRQRRDGETTSLSFTEFDDTLPPPASIAAPKETPGGAE